VLGARCEVPGREIRGWKIEDGKREDRIQKGKGEKRPGGSLEETS